MIYTIESLNCRDIVALQFEIRLPATVKRCHQSSPIVGVAEAERVSEFMGSGLQQVRSSKICSQ